MVAVAVPWLMLAEKQENAEIREFFDLSKGITHSMNLPELVGKCCLSVGFPGWLFTADKQGHMNLFHLFSRRVINLPLMRILEGYESEEALGDIDCTRYVVKAVLSADPLYSTDYVLAMIQGCPDTFAFWRPGETSFTSLRTTIPDGAYSDITWHDGKFYGVNFMGDIVIVDSTVSPIAAARVVRWTTLDLIGGCQIYIIYSMGQLLLITRDGITVSDDDDEGQDATVSDDDDQSSDLDADRYGAKTFHVYKINDPNSTTRYHYTELKDLGNRALFVGHSATLAVEDDQTPGCKGNHIYFTDDCTDTYYSLKQGGGKDMGVYNLLDGTIVPHYTGQSYHKFTPPLWIFSNQNHS